MKRMKIGIYDPYLDTMSGGEKYILSLAECLSNKNEVTILWDKTSREVIEKKSQERFGMDLRRFSFAPSLFNPTISLRKRYKASKRYDRIVYLSDGSIPIVGCPLIIHFQSPMNWVNGTSIKNKLKLMRVSKIICNSQFTKSYIDSTFGVTSQVLYPPVVVQGTYNPEMKENMILNVGRFGINHAGSSFKKQNVMAEVFTQMTKNGLKGWKLVFVMSVMDQDKKAVDEFISQYKNSQIEFVINPTQVVLWSYYQKAKIYWHASGFGEDIILHPDRAEHFGISTVEAMGVGAIPIVINAGGQKEIIEDGISGRLWSTTDELATYTLELINDENAQQKMTQHAIIAAKKFTGERFCDDVSHLIQ